jgi:tetratricopeptide (TPR) repeat protein
MLMHYIIHQQKLPETGQYLGLVLGQHVPVEEAIQKAYGMSSLQLEQAVKDYFHSQSALIDALDAARDKNPDPTIKPAGNDQAYRFAAPVGPDTSAITTKTMPEDDERALYAGVQLRVPDRRDAGIKELERLATTPTVSDVKAQAKADAQNNGKKDKAAAIRDKIITKDNPSDEDVLPTTAIGNSLAHRFLAWDHIEHSQWDQAITELGDTAALNQHDMWVRYYLSVLKYRMAQSKHGEMQGLANMMQDLKAVLEWYPEFADAYDLLALARNEGGGPTAAMQSERAAIGLSPRNEFYAYHLALIYIASKQWDAAKAQLERLKASSNPELATLAREQLDKATEEHKYGIPLNGALTQPKLAPQKSPFDVLTEDAAKREAAEKAEQTTVAANNHPAKYLQGRLVSVDCSQSPAAILTVRSDSGTLKLRAGDYKSLLVIGADQFSCSWRDRQVSINYKPGGLSDGDLVSLEVR